jgi:hypothetical protein
MTPGYDLEASEAESPIFFRPALSWENFMPAAGHIKTTLEGKKPYFVKHGLAFI